MEAPAASHSSRTAQKPTVDVWHREGTIIRPPSMWDDLRRSQKDTMGVPMPTTRRTLTAMKRIITTTIFAALVLAGVVGRDASATEVGYGRNFGLGFEVGNPTAIVGKYWVGRTNAWDFGLGFDGYYGDFCTYNNTYGACDGRWTIHADYLWQSNLVKSTAQLDWHIGAGGRLNMWDHAGRNYVAMGARMPVGLDLMFNNPSFLEVFFEIAPVLYVGPGVGNILWFAFDGNLGVRFYF